MINMPSQRSRSLVKTFNGGLEKWLSGSSKMPRFNSQYLHNTSRPAVTSVPDDLTPSPGLRGHCRGNGLSVGSHYFKTKARTRWPDSLRTSLWPTSVCGNPVSLSNLAALCQGISTSYACCLAQSMLTACNLHHSR